MRATKTSQKYPALAALLAVNLFFALGTGLAAKADTDDGSGGCDDPFHQDFRPARIRGDHELIFTEEQFEALRQLIQDPTVRITREELVLRIRGRHHQQEITISINGFLSAHHDGSRWIKFLDRDRDDRSWRGHIPLHDFLLNGGESFLSLFWRILKNRGALIISIRGEDIHILSADLIVEGTRQNPDCGSPGPTPSPSPVPTPPPPSTAIQSVTPPQRVTASSTIQFTFGSDQAGVTFACSLDHAAPASCSSPQSYSGLASGLHTFSVVATNSFGETDPNGARYTWVVNNEVPHVTIGTVVPSASITNSTTISVSFSSNWPAQAGIFTCSLDSGPATPCTSPVSYSALTQGTHGISVAEVNHSGKIIAQPATYQWQVDLTPPVAQFVRVTPSNTPNNSTVMSFTFSANETSSFTCSLDGAPMQSCTSPYTASLLIEGSHDFAIQATDVAGNVGNPVHYSWVADFTPPVVTLGNVVPPATGETNAKSVSVEFAANEPSTFTCSLDGAAAAACASPYTAPISTEGQHSLTISPVDVAGNAATPITLTWTMDYTDPMISFGAMTPSAAAYIDSTQLTADINANEPVNYVSTLDGVNLNQTSSPIALSNLAEGQHTLTLNAFDNAGNPANTITHVFTVDITPPVVNIGSSLASNDTNQTTNTLTFSANESATFQCDFDNAGYTACTSPYTVSGLAAGNHAFRVIATDLAGNASTPASYSWTADLTPPRTTITGVAPSGSLINQTGLSVAFSVSEAATSQCEVDGGAFSGCSSPFAASGLLNGSHTIQIRSIDLAGNVEPTPATYSFTVDTTPVIVTLVGTPAPLTNSTQASFSFAANKSNVTFACSLDGAAATACASPVSYSGLAAGAHAFSVTGRDSAGNISTPSSFSWTVDTTSPTTTILSETPSASLTNQTTLTITFSVNEPNSTSQCALDGAAAMACASPYAIQNLANGSHTITIRSTDSAGNVSAPASYSWTVDTTPPVTSIRANQAPNNGDSITFTLVSNEPNSTFTCALDGAQPAPCASTVSYGSLSAGSHSFYADATDAAGNTDPSGATYSFRVQAPLSTTISNVTPSATVTNQTSITLSFGSNVSGAAFICDLDGAAPSACTSPVTYSGLANGTHTFSVHASANGATDPNGASYSWTVDTTPPTLKSLSTSTTPTTLTINWTTSKPTTTEVFWGSLPTLPDTVPEDSTYVTSHTVTLENLMPGTVYYFSVAGHDQAGNFFQSSRIQVLMPKQ